MLMVAKYFFEWKKHPCSFKPSSVVFLRTNAEHWSWNTFTGALTPVFWSGHPAPLMVMKGEQWLTIAASNMFVLSFSFTSDQ